MRGEPAAPARQHRGREQRHGERSADPHGSPSLVRRDGRRIDRPSLHAWASSVRRSGAESSSKGPGRAIPKCPEALHARPGESHGDRDGRKETGSLGQSPRGLQQHGQSRPPGGRPSHSAHRPRLEESDWTRTRPHRNRIALHGPGPAPLRLRPICFPYYLALPQQLKQPTPLKSVNGIGKTGRSGKIETIESRDKKGGTRGETRHACMQTITRCCVGARQYGTTADPGLRDQQSRFGARSPGAGSVPSASTASRDPVSPVFVTGGFGQGSGASSP